jgi:hypothetical protein
MSAHDEAVAAAAEAMSADQLARRGQSLSPWESEVKLWKDECTLRAQAAITAYLSHMRASGSPYTAGAEAMRDAAAMRICHDWPTAFAAIRALPVPEPPAE